MEQDILEIMKYVGFWGLVTLIVLLCIYRYGDKIVELLKSKSKKNSIESLVISIKEETKQDKDRLYALIEDGKQREDSLSNKLDETNKMNSKLSSTNQGLAVALNQSVATNKELCDKVNFDINNIKEDVGDLKDSLSKINDHIIEIKCSGIK